MISYCKRCNKYLKTLKCLGWFVKNIIQYLHGQRNVLFMHKHADDSQTVLQNIYAFKAKGNYLKFNIFNIQLWLTRPL